MHRASSNLNSNHAAQADDTPHVGSIRFGPTLAAGLYLLLVGSAALALWVRQAPNALPKGLAAASPWVFLVFLIGFATYRLVLVQARKYPAAKAFFQIGAAALFFMLLLPASKRTFDRPNDPVRALLVDSNAEVRALAAEVAGHRPDGAKYGHELVRALQDSDASVRDAAHRSLVKLTGVDLGSPEDAHALKAWGEKFP
jgi:hypothetical protein